MIGKKVNVTAIFRNGDKVSPCNYRPVSLTSHVCKVLESLITDNIMEHVHSTRDVPITRYPVVSCIQPDIGYPVAIWYPVVLSGKPF